MERKTFIDPFTDMSFKRLFGQDDSKDLMIDFLNSVTGKNICDITYIDKEYMPAYISGRSLIYDVLCRTDAGDYVVVEMQRRKHENFIDRAVYYMARLIDRQTRRGSWNYELRDVTCVFLLDFYLNRKRHSKDSGQWIKDVWLTDIIGGGRLTDRVHAVFIEIPGFRKKAEECRTQLEKWLYTLKNMDKLQENPFKDDSKIFEEVERKMDLVGLTPREYEQYRNSLDLYLTNKLIVETAEKEGRQEGLQKGLEEGLQKGLEEGLQKGERRGERRGLKRGRLEERLRNAKAMWAEGIPMAQITKITGLTAKDIVGDRDGDIAVPAPV